MCLRGQYYTAVVHAKEQIKTDVQRRVLSMESPWVNIHMIWCKEANQTNILLWCALVLCAWGKHASSSFPLGSNMHAYRLVMIFSYGRAELHAHCHRAHRNKWCCSFSKARQAPRWYSVCSAEPELACNCFRAIYMWTFSVCCCLANIDE